MIDEIELGRSIGVIMRYHDPNFNHIFPDDNCVTEDVLKPTASINLKNWLALFPFNIIQSYFLDSSVSRNPRYP